MEGQLRRLGPITKIIPLKQPNDSKTKTWWVGRGTSCQIYTKSIYASRKHFSITYKDQKYFISDLESANGTFVNDERITSEKLLQFGNVISVGVPTQMQDQPESVVFVFEVSSDDNSKVKEVLPKDDDIFIIDEVIKKSHKDEEKSDCDRKKSKINTKDTNINLKVEPGVNETDKTVLNPSVNINEVVLVEGDSEKPCQPPKKRKLTDEAPVEVKEKIRKTEIETESKECTKPVEVNREPPDNQEAEEDAMAYEALTQVDEPEVKVEPDLLNYSITEELIEISDSDGEEWAPPSVDLKTSEPKTFEEAEEDDDVVFLKTIIKSTVRNEYLPPPVNCKVEDDFTETDKKWMEKLLKVKQEGDSCVGEKLLEAEQVELEKGDEIERTTEVEVGVESTSRTAVGSVKDVQPKKTAVAVETPAAAEAPVKKIRKAKKSVRFVSAPEVRFYEVPAKVRLTPGEKGRLQFMRTIFSICNWNSHWLEECKRVARDKDPTLCDHPLRKIPTKFPSHYEYMGTLIPVMLLQLWNSIKMNWVNSGEGSFRMTVSCDTYEDYNSDNLCVCKCSGIVQSVKAHQGLLREGHLVLLRLHQIPDATTPASHKYAKKLGYLVFGFVESKVYERFHGQPVHPALAERCSSIIGDLHIARLNILVKKRPNFKVDKRKLIQLTVVQHISPEIRMLRGICFLAESPLCKAILRPNKNQFSLATPPKTQDLVFKGPLDSCQRELVSKLSHTCTTTDHFLYSIHGSAGSGKSQVVLAFILQLLQSGGRRPKILYCTRSGAPLDEMVVRLKKQRDALEGRSKFSLVRIGQAAEAKPEVKDVCLSNVALTRLLEKGCKEGAIHSSEVQILEESNVICATCSSTGMTKMTSVFGKLSARGKKQRVICIIDEAMSCREADSIIPLLLGVTHLILVGDVHQLEPPFSGEKSHFLGADKSLFWRIYKNFANISRDLWPIYTLTGQYRMNPALVKLIGRIVYENLPSAPVTGPPSKITHLRSHLLLVDQTPEDVHISERKSREGRLVVQLVRTITKVLRGAGRGEVLRFAVISCDVKQSESLQAFLPKSKFPEVEVSDIQGAQGREVDVVLFHYDGSKLFNSQVAVAVTRARSSLFILTAQQSCEAHPWFQKLSEDAENHKFLKYVHPNMPLEALERIVSD